MSVKGVYRILQVVVVVLWITILGIAAERTYRTFVSTRTTDVQEEYVPADMRIEATPENGYYEGPVKRTPPSVSVIKLDAD